MFHLSGFSTIIIARLRGGQTRNMGLINQVSTWEFLQKLSTIRAHTLEKVSSSVLGQKVGRILVSRGVHMS